jgi:hypothetical protein
MNNLNVEHRTIRQAEHRATRLQRFNLWQQHVLPPVDRLKALAQTELGHPHGLELLFLS